MLRNQIMPLARDLNHFLKFTNILKNETLDDKKKNYRFLKPSHNRYAYQPADSESNSCCRQPE